MNNNEIADVENIIRQSRKAQTIAIDIGDSVLVDSLEQIISYSECLLPKGNRFRRDSCCGVIVK